MLKHSLLTGHTLQGERERRTHETAICFLGVVAVAALSADPLQATIGGVALDKRA